MLQTWRAISISVTGVKLCRRSEVNVTSFPTKMFYAVTQVGWVNSTLHFITRQVKLFQLIAFAF